MIDQSGIVSRQSVAVGGVAFVPCSLTEATTWLVHVAAARRIAVNVRLANAYNVALATKDRHYRQLLTDEGVNFPDGTPVVWFMRRKSHGSIPMQVRGPSFFSDALEAGVESGMRSFFLGGTPDTLTLLQARLRERLPGIQIAGVYSPPFAPVDEAFLQGCVERVDTENVDVVWVGLGTPKQDYVGTALAKRLGLPVVNVGAAFDFVAGTVREAPVWMRGSGFEWAYRLAREPRRLWRRYLVGNAVFLYSALRFELSRGRYRG